MAAAMLTGRSSGGVISAHYVQCRVCTILGGVDSVADMTAAWFILVLSSCVGYMSCVISCATANVSVKTSLAFIFAFSLLHLKYTRGI